MEEIFSKDNPQALGTTQEQTVVLRENFISLITHIKTKNRES